MYPKQVRVWKCGTCERRHEARGEAELCCVCVVCQRPTDRHGNCSECDIANLERDVAEATERLALAKSKAAR